MCKIDSILTGLENPKKVFEEQLEIFNQNFDKEILLRTISQETVTDNYPEQIRGLRILIRRLISVFAIFSENHNIPEELIIINKCLGEIRDCVLFGTHHWSSISNEKIANAVSELTNLKITNIAKKEEIVDYCDKQSSFVAQFSCVENPTFGEIHTIRKINRNFINLLEFLEEHTVLDDLVDLHNCLGEIQDFNVALRIKQESIPRNIARKWDEARRLIKISYINN